ncbi:exosome catalytic subunit dis3, partial [Tulasnella sp. 408]
MDLMEHDSFKVPIIILQTILEEVRHRSLPLYSRLKQLSQSEDKIVWTFYNEFSRSDVQVRHRLFDGRMKPRMTGTIAVCTFARDRALVPCALPAYTLRLGIRVATKWYNVHLEEARQRSPSKQQVPEVPVVVLLTDDAANRKFAGELGIPTAQVRDYVAGLADAGHLTDVLAADEQEVTAEEIQTTSKRSPLYTEHLSTSSCKAGVASGHFHQGYFNASQYNYLEVKNNAIIFLPRRLSEIASSLQGSVNVPAFSKPVLLIGRQNMNRAVDGDIVAVELLPQSEWRTSVDEVIDQEAALRNDDPDKSDAEEGKDMGEAEKKAMRHEPKEATSGLRNGGSSPQPTGRIVGIIKRNWRAYVCHIDRTSLSSHVQTGSTMQVVFATPLSRSIPRIRLRTRQAPSLLNQKILVTMDRWDAMSRYPEGHFVRSLGQVESKEAERESLLLEFDVPFRPFGRAVRCQDIDDALHARPLPNGNIEAGVHIADVSHFVHADTPMDSEAASRGTTVYLVDQRIDMLPSLLGTNLCSLRPHVERLAFSAIWELTPMAEIVNVRFTKSVIASKMAFTYEEAQKRMDDRSLSDPLTESIRLLNMLAKKLKAARMAAGALNLASPEIKIHLQSAESSDPIDVEQKALFETNSLVEEFMLLANVSVARRIYEAFPQTAVLRRHVAPPKTNFEKLQDILMKRKGIKLDVSSSGALAASLDHCIYQDPNEPSFNTLVRIMATRCMLAAEYFASGSVARDAFSHYGLASPIYTHFTSPIRRYA